MDRLEIRTVRSGETPGKPELEKPHCCELHCVQCRASGSEGTRI